MGGELNTTCPQFSYSKSLFLSISDWLSKTLGGWEAYPRVEAQLFREIYLTVYGLLSYQIPIKSEMFTASQKGGFVRLVSSGNYPVFRWRRRW